MRTGKKNLKKIISVILMLCMAMMILAGCGGEKKDDEKNKGEAFTVTDSIGRKIKFEKHPERVVANNCSLRLYCYVADVNKLVGIEEMDHKDSAGRPYSIANAELFQSDKLPIVGLGGSSDDDNYEQYINANPDVIFIAWGDKGKADKIQEKTGIPVVVLEYGTSTVFDPELYKSLRIIGKVMGTEEKAEKVIDYMEGCKKDLNDRTKDIPEEKKPSMYVGALAHCGPHGIESTSGKYAISDAVNGKNVADATGEDGIFMVDKEKIIDWNPEIVFLDLTGLKIVQEDYKKNPEFYKEIQAFNNGNIYLQLPYIWYHVNVDTAIADAYNIGKVLYPEQFEDIEPVKKADEIYEAMLGKKVYAQMAKDFSGGYQQITLDELTEIDSSDRT